MTDLSPLPRPKKSWGQHFLIDHNIQQKILDAAEIHPGERIVEIGPGRGILTQGLLERGAEVTAIEIDPLLVKALKQAWPQLNLVHADALQYPYEEIAPPYKVVANLPYNISTPLLFRFLEERRRISRMVLMLQREVAERLVAPVGVKSYGVLSVIFKLYMEIQIAFTVSRSCFRPRPRVDSAVVMLAPLGADRVFVREEAYFTRVVKAAFGHRRKQLLNALAEGLFGCTADLRGDRKMVEEVLSELGIDPTRRGETFSLSEFAQLANTLFDYKRRL